MIHKPKINKKKYQRVCMAVPRWTSEGAGLFHLFPKTKKDRRGKQVFWLFWVWAKIKND